MGFVYVVSDGINTKIGMTSNPKERIQNIKRELFSGVKDVSVSTHETPMFKQVEKIAKSYLSSKFSRVECEYKTEVFFASFDDVVLVVDDSIRKVEEDDLSKTERINRSSRSIVILRTLRMMRNKKA